MIIRKFSSENEFIHESTTFIVDTIVEAVALKDKAFVGLSGGTTPKPVYEELGKVLRKTVSEFSKTEFFLVDERYTPLEDDHSNYKLIQNSLLMEKQQTDKVDCGSGTGAHKTSFHSFNTSLSIDECLKDYEQELLKVPEASFDLIILGIGPDGHYASVFPDSEVIEKFLGQESKSFDRSMVAHTQTDQFTVRDRLTLVPWLILRSKKLLVLLKGSDKAFILDKLQEESQIASQLQNPSQNSVKFPAVTLIHHPKLFIHYLEQ